MSGHSMAIVDSGLNSETANNLVKGPLGARLERRLRSLGRAIGSLVLRYENYILALALTMVAAFSLLHAWRQPFHGDEYLARQTALAGSPRAVWDLLETAPLTVDPPLYYFLLSYWLRLFGPTELSVRFPSVLAYAVMCFLLYRFVRRYADVYTGLTLITLCLLSGSFAYSDRARPYSLVLAASALALSCWASLAEDRRARLPAIVGLFLGIAVAIGSHWFGFLVLAPLSCAEVVRTWRNRRIDLGAWAALVFGAATAIAYLPLLRAATAYRSLPWKGVQFADIPDTFRLVLASSRVPLMLVPVILIMARLTFDAPPASRRTRIPAPIFVCIVLFALVPFLAFPIAKVVTHAFQPRYALICVIGLLPLLALAIRAAANQRAILMAVAVLIIGVYASHSQYRAAMLLPVGGDTSRFADVAVFSQQPTLPIVPGNPELFLRLEERGPESLRNRCFFPIDADSIRFLHENTTFLMEQALWRWTKLPIVDLTSFLNAHPKFYLVQSTDMQDWLLQRMQEDHADIVFEGRYAKANFVYLVQVQHGSSRAH